MPGPFRRGADCRCCSSSGRASSSRRIFSGTPAAHQGNLRRSRRGFRAQGFVRQGQPHLGQVLPWDARARGLPAAGGGRARTGRRRHDGRAFPGGSGNGGRVHRRAPDSRVPVPADRPDPGRRRDRARGQRQERAISLSLGRAAHRGKAARGGQRTILSSRSAASPSVTRTSSPTCVRSTWMRQAGYLVVFDATHSVQRPGGGGDHTSGDGELAPVLARAAVAAGCDGVFMEVHENPAEALSDGPNQIPLRQLGDILATLQRIHEAAHAYNPGWPSWLCLWLLIPLTHVERASGAPRDGQHDADAFWQGRRAKKKKKPRRQHCQSGTGGSTRAEARSRCRCRSANRASTSKSPTWTRRAS